ncbi:MAG: hypothetical protein HRU09_18605 [Oligoflexales bacterium]|nr:hypothetical protein [Oligoflexales bacterium]
MKRSLLILGLCCLCFYPLKAAESIAPSQSKFHALVSLSPCDPELENGLSKLDCKYSKWLERRGVDSNLKATRALIAYHLTLSATWNAVISTSMDTAYDKFDRYQRDVLVLDAVSQLAVRSDWHGVLNQQWGALFTQVFHISMRQVQSLRELKRHINPLVIAFVSQEFAKPDSIDDDFFYGLNHTEIPKVIYLTFEAYFFNYLYDNMEEILDLVYDELSDSDLSFDRNQFIEFFSALDAKNKSQDDFHKPLKTALQDKVLSLPRFRLFNLFFI